MGIQSAIGDLGAFIAILTTLYIAEVFGWIFPFYLWAILGLLFLSVGLYLTRNINEKIVYKKKSKTRNSIREKIIESIKILKQQNLKLSHIPSKGQVVYLRRAANVAEGGTSVDVTNIASNKLKKLTDSLKKEFI